MKKHRFIFLLFLWIGLSVCLESQTPEKKVQSPSGGASSSQKGGSQKTVFPFFFLYSFGITPSEWNPLWPALLPPDSLTANNQERSYLQITITGKDLEYQIRFGKEGKPLKIPFFYGESSQYLQFKWDAQGNLEKLSLSSNSGKEEALYQVIQREGEKIAGLVYQKEAETFFIHLAIRSEEVEEVWYTPEGDPQIVFRFLSPAGLIYKIEQTTEEGTTDFLVREYTSFLKPSFEAWKDATYEVLYATMEKPRYVRMKALQNGASGEVLNPPAGTSLVEEQKKSKEEQWWYQYDERGRLVRLVYPDREYRYEYEDDRKGLWVRCRITPYAPRLGTMVPSQPFELTRIITYGKE
ncbi:MAG: hypothetical protein N2Z76_08430 [Treponemataceae bacterium]|nr:hypothetical protein [Treponemataceae bacterium]